MGQILKYLSIFFSMICKMEKQNILEFFNNLIAFQCFFNNPTKDSAPNSIVGTWDYDSFNDFTNLTNIFLDQNCKSFEFLISKDLLTMRTYQRIFDMFLQKGFVDASLILLDYSLKFSFSSACRKESIKKELSLFVKKKLVDLPNLNLPMTKHLHKMLDNSFHSDFHCILKLLGFPTLLNQLLTLVQSKGKESLNLRKFVGFVFSSMSEFEDLPFSVLFLVVESDKINLIISFFSEIEEEDCSFFRELQTRLTKAKAQYQKLKETLGNIYSVESWDNKADTSISNLFNPSAKLSALISNALEHMDHKLFFSKRSLLKSVFFKKFFFKCLILYDHVELCKFVMSKREIQVFLAHIKRFETEFPDIEKKFRAFQTQEGEFFETILENMVEKDQTRTPESKGQLDSKMRFFTTENLRLFDNNEIYMEEFFVKLKRKTEGSEKLPEEIFKQLSFYFDGIDLDRENKVLQKYLKNYYSFSKVLNDLFHKYSAQKFSKNQIEKTQGFYKKFEKGELAESSIRDLFERRANRTRLLKFFDSLSQEYKGTSEIL